MPRRTRLRDCPYSAFRSQKLWMQNLIRRVYPRRKDLHIRRLNAHLARDAGLSDADLERYKFKLPSQTTHHPRS